MNFLKDIKIKALAVANLSEKQQIKKQLSEKSYQSQKVKKQINLQDIANLFLKKAKKVEAVDQFEQKKQEQNQISKVLNGQSKFWKVAQPELDVTNTKIQDNYLPDEQYVCQFFQNACKFQKENQNRQKDRIRKAKNNIFGSLQMQPIYMQNNIQQKLLKMEMENNIQQMIERTQILVLQKNSVDRTIQKILISGYLYEANEIQNALFIQQCCQIINQNSQKIELLCLKVSNLRFKIKIISKFIKNVISLNSKKNLIARKLKILKELKSHYLNTSQQFKNIDQAFYIERSRQKTYANYVCSEKLMKKVNLLQNLMSKIKNQNQKLVMLVQKSLDSWIDKKQVFQKKHIEKLLILLYFIQNQKMYTSNGMTISIKKIKDKQFFIEQLIKIQNWNDYKYVNDQAVKDNVKRFLNSLIQTLSSSKFEKTE